MAAQALAGDVRAFEALKGLLIPKPDVLVANDGEEHAKDPPRPAWKTRAAVASTVTAPSGENGE